MVLGYLSKYGPASSRDIARGLKMGRHAVRDALAEIERNGSQPKPRPEGYPKQLELTPPDKKQQKNAMSSEFLGWWKDYPVKRNRYKAWAEWKKAKLDKHADALVKSLLWQINRKKEIAETGEFVEEFQHGERYIRNKRWHDEF